MKYEDYKQKREELINQASAAIDAGKMDDAEDCKSKIVQLDANYQKEAEAMANLSALSGTPVPAPQVMIQAESAAKPAEATSKSNDEKLYRSAFFKTMMQSDRMPADTLRLTADEQRVFDARNAFTHTTENTGILIPTTTAAGIWARAEVGRAFLADVQRMAVPGELRIIKHTAIAAGDAAAYAEGTDVADEQNTFGEMILKGNEYAKSVTFSWKLRAMAIDQFEAFLIQELGARVGAVLGQHAINGTGSATVGGGQLRGVLTAVAADAAGQVATYAPATGISYDDLLALIARVHESYIGSAVIYANSKTIWTQLAAIKDTTKRPIFAASIGTGGLGNILGAPVKADAGVPDGTVLLAAPSEYILNISQPFMLATEDHAKARTTDYVGYLVADADLRDPLAVAVLEASEAV